MAHEFVANKNWMDAANLINKGNLYSFMSLDNLKAIVQELARDKNQFNLVKTLC